MVSQAEVSLSLKKQILPETGNIAIVEAPTEIPPTDTGVEHAFACPHCSATFVDSRALGGHASKLHPGKSDAYNHKLKRREERKGQRMALALAKHLVT